MFALTWSAALLLLQFWCLSMAHMKQSTKQMSVDQFVYKMTITSLPYIAMLMQVIVSRFCDIALAFSHATWG